MFFPSPYDSGPPGGLFGLDVPMPASVCDVDKKPHPTWKARPKHPHAKILEPRQTAADDDDDDDVVNPYDISEEKLRKMPTSKKILFGSTVYRCVLVWLYSRTRAPNRAFYPRVSSSSTSETRTHTHVLVPTGIFGSFYRTGQYFGSGRG